MPLEIEDSLIFEGISSRRDQISNASASTLDWVWNVLPEQQSLAHWLAKGSGVFWIYGKLGSGKSTLMKYIASHHMTRQLLKRSDEVEIVITEFFFDFRAGSQISNNLEGLLRSLLLQLVQAVPQLSSLIREHGISKLSSEASLQWSSAKLWKTLEAALSSRLCEICAFIDGLDEFAGKPLDLINFVTQIEAAGVTTKLCLASRPEPIIMERFCKHPGFRLQDYNKQSVEACVKNTLKILPNASSDSRIPRLANYITTSADGVILWARLVLDELLEGFANGDDLEELQMRLDKIPKDIQAVYSRILERIDSDHKRESTIMLILASNAKRPLLIQELQTAVQIAINDSVRCFHPTDSTSRLLFQRRVRARTGGLLKTLESDNWPRDITGSENDKNLSNHVGRPVVVRPQSYLKPGQEIQCLHQ